MLLESSNQSGWTSDFPVPVPFRSARYPHHARSRMAVRVSCDMRMKALFISFRTSLFSPPHLHPSLPLFAPASLEQLAGPATGPTA
jgi:hypothetical protein